MRTLRTLALVVSAAAGSAGAQSAPCFEPSLGADLGLGDDQVAQGNALGFAFPFAGSTVTSIDVSSNGFVWLAPNAASGCCNGDPAQFLADSPRIAPLWTDLDPGSAGSVHFATFPGRAVVTWSQVPEFGQGAPLTAQVQLLSDGSIVLYWDLAVAVAAHTTLVGVTPGNGAPNPGPIDLSAALPFDSGTVATVYQSFAAGSFDLGGVAVQLTPNGRGGYLVTRRNDCQLGGFEVYGRGCPVEPSVYELFAQATVDVSGLAFDFTPDGAGGYRVTACGSGCLDPGYAAAPSLGLGDDDVARAVPLGFTFPFAGGATSEIDVSSNGLVYLTGNAVAGHGCCNGDPGAFLAGPPAVGVLWQDLDPGSAGAVRTHRPDARTFVVTYDAVPEYRAPGSAYTAQLQLRDDGRMRLAYGAVGNAAHACLVGFTPGRGASDPGSLDLTAGLPYGTGPGGVPVTFFAAQGSRPTVGADFTTIVGNAPAGARDGVLLIGATSRPGGVPLRAIGMPGCALYTSAEIAQPFVVQGTYSQIVQRIPNAPALVGASLFAQPAVVAPGVNPLGVVVANAGRIEIGR